MISQIVEESISFYKSPELWFQKYEGQQILIQKKIEEAQKLLNSVRICDAFRFKISQVCSNLGVEGLRGDLVITRAAKALAAFNGRTEVALDDIRQTIVLCLRHRLRRDPMEPINSGEKIEIAFENFFCKE